MYFVERIYINEKPLILTNSTEAFLQAQPDASAYEQLVGAFHRNFKMAKKHLDQDMSVGVIIEDTDIEVIKKEVLNYFKHIYAGGGLVENEAGEFLLIHRRGKWDLPKGKLDDGEDIEACALREVSEETGLQNVTIGPKIMDTFHIYTEKNKDIIKTTVWYRMYVSGKPELVPQEEEQIAEAIWVSKDELIKYSLDTYANIRDVFSKMELI